MSGETERLWGSGFRNAADYEERVKIELDCGRVRRLERKATNVGPAFIVAVELDCNLMSLWEAHDLVRALQMCGQP